MSIKLKLKCFTVLERDDSKVTEKISIRARTEEEAVRKAANRLMARKEKRGFAVRILQDNKGAVLYGFNRKAKSKNKRK